MRRQTEEAWLSATPFMWPPGTRKPTPRERAPGTPEPTVFHVNPELDTASGAGYLTGGAMGSLPGMEFYGINCWYVDSEGGRVRTKLCAGAFRENPMSDFSDVSQGGLDVTVWAMTTQDGVTFAEGQPGGGDYSTPTKHGPVTILGAVSERLTLQAADGITFYFDVPTRQFVPSLDTTVTPAPSATGPESPLPTGTPVP